MRDCEASPALMLTEQRMMNNKKAVTRRRLSRIADNVE
jgi:hypothetical protein